MRAKAKKNTTIIKPDVAITILTSRIFDVKESPCGRIEISTRNLHILLDRDEYDGKFVEVKDES